MKPIEYYSTYTVEYPAKADFTNVFLYKRGSIVFSGTLKEYNLRSSSKVGFEERSDPPLIEKVLDQDAYNNVMLKYRSEHSRLMEEFKNDLFEEFSVQDNPKREKCYCMAYERAHSDGLNSVATEFAELVELIY
jgi:hypothetical protein